MVFLPVNEDPVLFLVVSGEFLISLTSSRNSHSFSLRSSAKDKERTSELLGSKLDYFSKYSVKKKGGELCQLAGKDNTVRAEGFFCQVFNKAPNFWKQLWNPQEYRGILLDFYRTIPSHTHFLAK